MAKEPDPMTEPQGVRAKRKRRSREEIAAERHNAMRRRDRREKKRAARLVEERRVRQENAARREVLRREREALRLRKAAAAAPSASTKAAKRYEADKAQAAERERRRQLQAHYEDFAYGRDTEGARLVAASLAMIGELQASTAKGADPLNLTRHTKPPSPKEAKKREKEERAAKGLRTETILAEDGSRQAVDARGPQLRKLEQQEVNALRRVAEDYEVAYGAGLRCRGFEPSVDGTSAHGAHAARLIVQDRLAELRRHLGNRDYDVLVAFVVQGLGPFNDQQDADENKTIAEELRRIIRRAVAFYNPGSEAQMKLAERDKMWKVAQAVIAAMERDLEKPPVARRRVTA